MKKLFTEEIEKFIHDNVKGMYVEDLVDLINSKFNTDYTYDQVKNYKSRHKLKSGVPNSKPTGPIVFPTEVQVFIVNNIKGTKTKDLVNMINDTFNSNYTYTQVKGYTSRYGLKNGLDATFKKGDVPHNKGKKGVCGKGCEKTWFKKGQAPINHRPVGSERIDSKDGYILIKTAEPRTWKHKHRVIWEQHNGPIPRNHVVIFLDGDKTNIDISNLALITRSELNILNQNKLIYDNAETTRSGIAIAKVIDTSHKRKRKK